jgi:NADPH:quinone reductase-like Zn-dependent oxidoreductase
MRGSASSPPSGWETLCGGQHRTGYSVDGSYAEYLKASARYVGHVPNGMDPFEAAPLTCAGVTTCKAVKASKARPSDLVDDKLRLAQELGGRLCHRRPRRGPGGGDPAVGRG